MASFDVLGELIALSNRQKPPGRVSGLIRGAIAGGATPNIAAGGGTDIMRAMQSSLQDRVEDELIFHNMRRQVLGDIAQEQDRRRSGERQDVRTRADLIGATGQPGQVDFGGSSFQLPGIGGRRRMETEADIESLRTREPVLTDLEIERMRKLQPLILEQEQKKQKIGTFPFKVPEEIGERFGLPGSLNIRPEAAPDLIRLLQGAHSPERVRELHFRRIETATQDPKAQEFLKKGVDAALTAGDIKGAGDVVDGYFRTLEQARLTSERAQDPMRIEQIAAIAAASAAAGTRARYAVEQESRGGELSGPALQQLNTLGDNIRQDKDIQNYSLVRSMTGIAENAAKSRSGPGDLALLRTFARILDPQSAVREEEFRSMETSLGALQRLGVQVSKGWYTGERLTDSGRAAILKETKNAVAGWRSAYDRKRKLYERQARAAGLSPNLVFAEEDEPAVDAPPTSDKPTKSGPWEKYQ